MNHVLTQKAEAEMRHLKAMTRKLEVEIFWYPLALASGLIAAIVTATVTVLKLTGLL